MAVILDLQRERAYCSLRAKLSFRPRMLVKLLIHRVHALSPSHKDRGSRYLARDIIFSEGFDTEPKLGEGKYVLPGPGCDVCKTEFKHRFGVCYNYRIAGIRASGRWSGVSNRDNRRWEQLNAPTREHSPQTEQQRKAPYRKILSQSQSFHDPSYEGESCRAQLIHVVAETGP